VNKITIGEQTSIGDRAVVHVAKIHHDMPTHIGSRVTIGTSAHGSIPSPKTSTKALFVCHSHLQGRTR
jgi:acetyltransferase-like isoleucine patch superfamily enzyme